MKNPLDVSRFEQNPCLALTSAQLQELNLPQGTQQEAALGQECEWLNRETQGLAALAFLSKSGRGLSGAYAARNAGKYAYFVVLPDIEGYPAVASDLADTRDKGNCFVDVGVSDRLSFQMAGRLSGANIGKKDPCQVTAMAAGMVLKTMKAGG